MPMNKKYAFEIQESCRVSILQVSIQKWTIFLGYAVLNLSFAITADDSLLLTQKIIFDANELPT